MGGKSNGGSSSSYKKGDYSDPRFANSINNPEHASFSVGKRSGKASLGSQDGESRSYAGGKGTQADYDSLKEAGVSAFKGLTAGPVGAAVRFMGTSVINAKDVEAANRLGVSLDDARLARKHGLLEDDDDEGNGGGYGGLGSDSDAGSAGGAGNGGMGRGGSEGTWA